MIKPDNSVDYTQKNYNDGYKYEMENVSPVLKGEDGLKALKVVCSVTEKYATANVSCGLHVHHCVKHDEKRNLKTFINKWMAFEDVFYACLPPSRQNNQFCRKLSYFPGTVYALNRRTTLRNWWNQYVGTRYTAVNMESYWLRGTIEYRLHSGTVKYEKISNWVLVTQAFTTNALKNKVQHNETTFDALIEYLKSTETKRKIEVLVEENPRREGTKARERFALYQNGMTVQQFILAGGKMVDVQWDIKHNFIAVDPIEATEATT